MHIILSLLIVACLLDNSSVSFANLTVDGVACGDSICGEDEYCSPVDRRCYPCKGICDRKHHNFDQRECENSCQGYLHDIRYVKNTNNNPNGYQGLSEEVQKWKTLSIVTLTLLILIVIIFAIYETYKWKKSNNITISSLRSKYFSKKNDSQTKTPQNGVNELTTTGRPELRIEIPPSITQSDSPSTMTTGISRLPAEDSALDYAYDNPAMTSNASSPNVKPHESAF